MQLITTPRILTAVIRSRVPRSELSRFVPAACGEVWEFIRAKSIRGAGRHVALYLEGGVVEVGAEVSERFDGDARVTCSHLPAGRAVTTPHFGPYGRLGEVHAEVREWSARQGHELSEICWEVYGHWDESWNADPSKIRTDVFHLLQNQKGQQSGGAAMRLDFDGDGLQTAMVAVASALPAAVAHPCRSDQKLRHAILN